MPEPEVIVYDGPHGTSALHEAGTVRRDEYRVTWEHRSAPEDPWVPGFLQYAGVPADAESSARAHHRVLVEQARAAPDFLRLPKLERRTVWESPWREPIA
jgi:hypothetical protein